jgi:hypothetical protein
VGGFLGIGGSSAKTDRSNVLQGFTNLKNLFNWGLPTAQQGQATGAGYTAGGVSRLGEAGDYFRKLMGSRTQAMQAIAPETAAIQSQADATQRQLAAKGTARGGGVAGTAQQIRSAALAEADRALFGVRPGAAQAAAGIGAQQAGIGLGQQQAANQLAGISEYAAGDLARIANQARQTDYEINRQTQQSIIGAVLGAMTGIPGGPPAWLSGGLGGSRG